MKSSPGYQASSSVVVAFGGLAFTSSVMNWALRSLGNDLETAKKQVGQSDRSDPWFACTPRVVQLSRSKVGVVSGHKPAVDLENLR